jgi:hypothetical protein
VAPASPAADNVAELIAEALVEDAAFAPLAELPPAETVTAPALVLLALAPGLASANDGTAVAELASENFGIELSSTLLASAAG